MRHRLVSPLFALALALSTTGCLPSEPAPQVGVPFTASGCPVPGRAMVHTLASDNERPEGPHALALAGDVMLASTKAAFIIAKPGDEQRTYYYYGGILVDAVPVEEGSGGGCQAAAPERFGELAVMAGQLDATDFASSVLRAFRGERIEVLNDGADGQAAVVRVHGVDDKFWLVEMELQRRAWEGGQKKPPTSPLGIRFDVDYVLEPDSAVLQVIPRLTNTTGTPLTLLAGGTVFIGDTTPYPDRPHFPERLAIGGFGIGYGAPWFAFGADDGSYAVTIDTPRFGNTNIAGVNALIDVSQALEQPLELAAAGSAGDSATMRFLVSVGATDRNSATRPLIALGAGGFDNDAVPVAGQVHEPDGTPVAGATIDVQRREATGGFTTLDELRTDSEGRFSGSIPYFGDGIPWRLVAKQEGRTDSAPLDVTLPSDLSALDFTLLQAGGLGYVVKDPAGAALPAKLTLVQEGRVVRRLFTVDGTGEAAVEPGSYDVVVSRGYEYALVEAKVEVKPAQTATVQAVLERVVDTTGWLSMDGHVHQAPSDDSTVAVARRMDTIAAEGLEVMVATDHEYIADLAGSADARRLAPWIAVMNGQEVTASSPEHTNMWGVPVDDSKPRGTPVRWYGKGLAEIFDRERARGAKVTVLNHPREHNGCSWLCAIDWDRLTGEPRAGDAETFGLDPGQALWTWDFDAVELLNGMKDVFLREDPRRTGKFDDWMAFHNLGHRITGVAVTDTHDEHDVGAPRTYFPAPTDTPSEFREEMLENAIKGGRATLSAGAFATVSIDGKGPGETVTGARESFPLAIRVQAVPQVDVNLVKVFVNCDEVASIEPPSPDAVLKLDTTVPLTLDRDAHVVVVGWGVKEMPVGFVPVGPATPRFITNPVFVDVDGDGWKAPGGKACRYSAPR